MNTSDLIDSFDFQVYMILKNWALDDTLKDQWHDNALLIILLRGHKSINRQLGRLFYTLKKIPITFVCFFLCWYFVE